ncbi:MAG: sterol desaturase family protein [Alphaproteobacteria bacterium]
MDFVVTSSPEARGVLMYLTIAAVAAAEALWPRRAGVALTIRRRWPAHFLLAVVNTFAIRLTALGLAFALTKSGWTWGVVPALGLPFWSEVVVVYLALDITRYALHVALHRVPLLWRLHAVHHVDQEYDFTTGLRFHPFEVVVTTAAVAVPIVLLGASPEAVLVNEFAVIVFVIVAHANTRVPAGLDRWARLVVITPDVHRVHHSTLLEEGNTNFGITLILWDRLFGTYRAGPRAGHEAMTIGLDGFRAPGHQRLAFALVQPFRRQEPGFDGAASTP